jgi:hypothetical protein
MSDDVDLADYLDEISDQDGLDAERVLEAMLQEWKRPRQSPRQERISRALREAAQALRDGKGQAGALAAVERSYARYGYRPRR